MDSYITQPKGPIMPGAKTGGSLLLTRDGEGTSVDGVRVAVPGQIDYGASAGNSAGPNPNHSHSPRRRISNWVRKLKKL